MKTSPAILLPTALAVALLLGGCAAVGPEHRRPAVATGEGWSRPADAALDAALLARWWTVFGDTEQDRLIEQALLRNHDLATAAANIAAARAALARADAAGRPAVTGRAGIERRRLSRNSPEFNPQRAASQTVADLGVDASWELDLFGSLQRQREAAAANLAASESDRVLLRIGVAAEVVRLYQELRGAQRERSARQEQVAAAERALDLVGLRQRAGEAAASERDRAEARVALARAALPALDARIEGAVLALGQLAGGLPESELGLAASPATAEPQLAPIPLGQRADLLRRRPDVIAAEQRLAAATAQIGIATAELFPKLSLGLGGGLRALALGDLAEADSRRASVLPLVSWRLFDGGRIRAEIHAAEARQLAAALQYEQAVLAALGDAERSLVQYQHGLQALAAQRQALQAVEQAAAAVRLRVSLGDASELEWTEARAEMADAQLRLQQASSAAVASLVALYKSLGGGWAAG
ncbi:efflux transporter outer membrane subunit [Paucibacter sp. M5-1]|uniref:efflux transporter outer membrane subunit n=1 Tax=Paucibacter sp. M5-1 TaxID=3015998 RepID=UPI0022B91670|nr:TolC family protein [Paucibacter sp. M5-1]MCZ7880080.1 TolC family protein [Paucibacter sp. M5-1]